MAGYLIANLDIHDAAAYDQYRQKVGAVIAQYGGRFIVRGGTIEPVEGEVRWKRVVVLEFPSYEAARRFYHSKEYAPLIALRAGAAKSDIVLVEGYDG
jgi:uncharacterized protein (DUF1330 family)